MKPQELHRNAMELAKKGLLAKSEGKLDESMKYFEEALNLESKAAYELYTKFEIEPTRSVLFRSAASMALNCGQYEIAKKLIYSGLSGNPPNQIMNELKLLENQIDLLLEQGIEEESFSYMQLLREKAINLRVYPKSHIHKEAVFISDVLSVLRNLRTSFSNFIEVQYLKNFEYDKPLINKLQKDFGLLIVDTKHRSFGASLSTDALVMSSTNYLTKDLEDWKRKLFDDYKKDVIDIDFQSDDDIKLISEKYSKEERRLIYTNILNMYSENTPYNISYTDRSFDTKIQPKKPVSKSIKQLIIPNIENTTEDKQKELLRTYRFSIDGTSKKEDIISEESISYAEFNHTLTEINHNKDVLYLKEPITFKIIYENGIFSIEFPIFDIYVTSTEHKNIILFFYEECLKKYHSIISSDETSLSHDEKVIKENFTRLVQF